MMFTEVGLYSGKPNMTTQILRIIPSLQESKVSIKRLQMECLEPTVVG